MPFSGRRMSSPTGRSSSRVWQASTLNLRRIEARITFSSIIAKRWPEKHTQQQGFSKWCTVLKYACSEICPVLTDTVTEPSWKGEVRIRRPSYRVFREKTLRLELFRFREVSLVAVEGVGNDDSIGTFGHLKTIYRNKRSIIFKKTPRLVKAVLRDVWRGPKSTACIIGPTRSKHYHLSSEPARLWFPLGTLRRNSYYFVERAGRRDSHLHKNGWRCHVCLRISQRGIRYKENRMGSRTEPCGTPLSMGTDADSQGLDLTEVSIRQVYWIR